MMYYVASNQNVQDKLRKEILSVLPSKDTRITAQDLEKMPYVKATIKETTRIAPIAVLQMRKTKKDIVLSGYQIPKGVSLLKKKIIIYFHVKKMLIFRLVSEFLV